MFFEVRGGFGGVPLKFDFTLQHRVTPLSRLDSITLIQRLQTNSRDRAIKKNAREQIGTYSTRVPKLIAGNR
ncbi:MAG: hypothetical protein HY327_03075 [Chloroflexi bacterium]|nr:hypothetical protein [Chloroflexota bacterium]